MGRRVLIELDLDRQAAMQADPQALVQALSERLVVPEAENARLDPALEAFGLKVLDVLDEGERCQLAWEPGRLRRLPSGNLPLHRVGPEDEVRRGDSGGLNRDD